MTLLDRPQVPNLHQTWQRGWIVNLADDRYTREELRAQQPTIVLDNGEWVWEVWFFHRLTGRWFVMSYYADQRLMQQGVVYFRPGDLDTPRRWIAYFLSQKR